jgi:uncharacterized protein YqeY
MYNRGMVTKEALEARLHEAMRSGDAVEKRTLRGILSAWKLVEVDRGGPLDEQAALSLLQKEAKTRHESIADAEKADRNDLVESSQAELDFLKSFLPQRLSDAELELLAQHAIEEAGATTLDQMGQVMKLLMPRVQGRAEGKLVSQMVRNLLSSS